jgi:predicted nucleotidyltransferase
VLSALYPNGKNAGDRRDAGGSVTVEGYDMVRVRNSVTKQIQCMVRRIVADFDPDQIILFGSHARGQAGPDSDVDLLVVMPVEGSKRAKQPEIRAAVRDIHVPKDIIVSRPEEFQWRKDTVGTIEHPAAQEGEVLYARKCHRHEVPWRLRANFLE